MRLRIELSEEELKQMIAAGIKSEYGIEIKPAEIALHVSEQRLFNDCNDVAQCFTCEIDYEVEMK